MPGPLNHVGGKRYDAMLKCIRHGGTFTTRDVGVHPITLKSLFNDGILAVVEKRRTWPPRPYTYRVTDYIMKRFADEAGQ